MNVALRAALATALLVVSACSVVPKGQGASVAPPPVRTAKAEPPVTRFPPASKPPAATTESTPNARSAGVRSGPALQSLGISAERARSGLIAFRTSCPSLVRRSDGSGLTNPQDWAGACAVAATWPDGSALGFFSAYFETAVIGDGKAFATGYYEPEIAGSRIRQPGYEVPIYRRPPDLIEVDLGLFSDGLKGKKIRGRVDSTSFVPYFERAQIESGALAGRGLELAWAADPVEFFFLQVQGSGRLRLPDGSVMRIGYDSQNGRDYTGIGAMLRDRGQLLPGQGSMQGIMSYLRGQPDGGRAVMNENKSFVFFRELTGDGPVGALGVAVIPQITVAADPVFVPLGAPVVLRLDRTEASGLWVAQDTGGAIKGANRFDTFWGAGDAARTIAGGMSARGQAWLLLPIGTIARLNGGISGGAVPQP